MNEATARLKINKLLESGGWRFFAEGDKPANIRLESSVTITQSYLDGLGHDFEKTSRGIVDFLLLDARGFPLIVLEAKSEGKSPLVGKEQARKYARSLNCRFVILSNGNLHYFWDLERGNPYIITVFPSPDSVSGYREIAHDPTRLVGEPVRDDYLALTRRPNFASEAGWKREDERPDFIKANKLYFLRDYQLKAVWALQRAVKGAADRFLFEMATGTGKTLVAAAVIKLFLRSRNARRVLFLVDRLELEIQAHKAFTSLLSADFQTVIYKEKRDAWRRAEIVVSTVQSFLFNNKYQRLFSPTDFDLVISDEAHRSISGNARAVFDYFVGYKLGLTATPRDYLRGFDSAKTTTRDPREAERRLLMDTYRTFGCESGQPTFRYSLLDGVKDGFLINPTVVDARTEITTELLSEDGFVVSFTDDGGVGASYTYFADNDVLLSKVTPCFENGKAGIARNLKNGIGFGSSEFYVLRSSQKTLPEWIYFCVTHPHFRQSAINNMTGTGGLQRVPRKFVEGYEIPLPPLDVQRKIVAEIEGYQRVIDGARAVVDNYRPHIVVDPEWPMVELGNAAELIGGYAFKSSNMTATPSDATDRLVVKIGNIERDGSLKMKIAKFHPYSDNLARFKLHKGDVVVAMTGATVGKVAVVEEDGLLLNQRVGVLRAKSTAIQSYIYYLSLVVEFYNYCQRTAGGGAQRNIAPREILKYKIPLPPIETQQIIVDEIEAEYTLVAANRELIERFEKKIQGTISRVWAKDKTERS